MSRSWCLAVLLGASSLIASERPCPYPAEPTNWIYAYCAFEAESDDEITIGETECYKLAKVDLKRKDRCSVKETYKRKICQILKEQTDKPKKTFIETCLKDTSIKPYYADGG